MGCGNSLHRKKACEQEASKTAHEQWFPAFSSAKSIPSAVMHSIAASVAHSPDFLLRSIHDGHNEHVRTQVVLGCDFSTAILGTVFHESYELAFHSIFSQMKEMQDGPGVHAYGFGDLHTQSDLVFCFQQDDRACCDAQECMSRLCEIRKHATAWGPLSFAPMIWQSMKLVRLTRKHHTLILLVHSDHDAGLAKKTSRALSAASNYPLSIIIVGIGERTWNVTSKFHRKNCNFVKFDSSIQQDGDIEVLQARFATTAMKGHAANYREAQRRNMIGDAWKAPSLEEVITVCSPPDRAVESDPWYGLPSGWDAYWDTEREATVYVQMATKQKSFIPPATKRPSNPSSRRLRNKSSSSSSLGSGTTSSASDPCSLGEVHDTAVDAMVSEKSTSASESRDLKVAAQGSPPQMVMQKDESSSAPVSHVQLDFSSEVVDKADVEPIAEISLAPVSQLQSGTFSTVVDNVVVETKPGISSTPANHMQLVSSSNVCDNVNVELSEESQRDQRAEENPNGSVTNRLLLPLANVRENDLQKKTSQINVQGEQLQADVGLKRTEDCEPAEKKDGKLTWPQWVALDIRKGDYIEMHLEGLDQFTLHRLCAGVEGSEGLPFVEDVIAHACRHRKQREQVAYQPLERETRTIDSTTTIGSKRILWM